MDRSTTRALASLLALAALAASTAAARAGTADDGPPFQSFTYAQEPAFGFCPPLDAVFRASVAPDAAGQHILSLSILELGDGFPPEPGCRPDIPVFVPDACAREVLLPSRALNAAEAARLQTALERAVSRLETEPSPDCGLIDPCRVRVFTVDQRRLTDFSCDEARVTAEDSQAIADLLEELREAEPRIRNGDTNGDHARDVSDAVYLLSHLFLGGPAPVAATCSIALPCPPEATVVLENGDTDGDRQRSLTDAVHLLNWLFLEGAPPAETCSCKPGAGCEPPCEPPDLCLPAASEPLTFTCTSALATCEDVRAVYNFLTERVDPSCNPAVGCHVVLGHCGIGLGGCWYAVSRTVKQEYLDALAERFLELGGLRECVSGVCDCAPPPPSASCVEGRCLADR